MIAKDIEDRHPSITAITRYFDYDHLPLSLQVIAARFADLVDDMLEEITEDSPELSVGLRKLLEAKDCFVRAAL